MSTVTHTYESSDLDIGTRGAAGSASRREGSGPDGYISVIEKVSILNITKLLANSSGVALQPTHSKGFNCHLHINDPFRLCLQLLSDRGRLTRDF